MSRCFPFPPPGYEVDGRLAARIESIKLLKEKKSRKDRKEKSRDRKKKRERKHKEGKKGGRKDQKPRESDAEQQLAKSSLSEEHGQPVGDTQNHYDSSDSISNSSKRQKLCPPPDNMLNSGSKVRTRLATPQKHKGQEVELNPCSTSPSTAQEMPSSTSRLFQTRPMSSKGGRSSSIKSKLLEDLFANWVPPPLQNACSDLSDQEWLFSTKKENHIPSDDPKKLNANGVGSSCQGVGLSCQISTHRPPQCCYLPEACVFALPFTVPF